MRKALVFRNGEIAGTLIQNSPENYEFIYNDNWFLNDKLPAISLTFPKSRKAFQSDHLFPFFFNLLSEGVNKELQCRQLKIDENDYFGLLLATASIDTIGAITISPFETEE